MDVIGKNVLVIGLGRTGRSVARFLVSQGGHVCVSESRTGAALASAMAQLDGLPVEVRPETDPELALRGIDLVIPSPGVPVTAPLLTAAVSSKVPIWSEIELAFRLLSCPLLAVTGTNGKSTTTTLLGEMLRQSGRRVFTGGNLGTPLIEAMGTPYDVAVAEISSFQLEWVHRFRPQIGLFLNLSEDHLDRHGSVETYGAVKRRLFLQQRSVDWVVMNRDDPLILSLCQELPGQLFSFGWAPPSENSSDGAKTRAWRGTWIDTGTLVVRHADRETRYALDGLRIRGRHNIANVMAAVSAATLWGTSPGVIQTVLARFPGLPHRLEFVAEKNGVTYINDSKGTNVDAVVQSLQSFSGPIILLAGGVEKGGDYRPLREPVRTRVKKLILFGQAQYVLQAALGRETETLRVEALDAAVQAAQIGAQAGDTVLLSPACASFDQFQNYTHRGEVFRSYVEAL